MTATYAELSVK